jgi:hypothetical protein
MNVVMTRTLSDLEAFEEQALHFAEELARTGGRRGSGQGKQWRSSLEAGMLPSRVGVVVCGVVAAAVAAVVACFA